MANKNKMKKGDLIGKPVEFSTYYGTISLRIKDSKGSRKSLVKIEMEHLQEYIQGKINKGKFVIVEDGHKGNILTEIKLK